MKFTQNWLGDHLCDCDLEQILTTLPHIGLEVEHVSKADGLDQFQLAHITEISPHPEADRLRIVRVRTKDGEYSGQIVCGAPNLRIGQMSVLALPGQIIPATGKKLRASKIRGQESLGMLCSGAELAISDEAGGILDLDQSLAMDLPVTAALGLDEVVIDVEITPNRPDWAGVRGIARDLAAAGCGRLVVEAAINFAEQGESPLRIRHAFSDDALQACPFFAGRYMKNVKNQAAPQWMQQRLRAVGQHPINALVDITNYICLDRTRPLHIYDADKITGDIILRMASDGEILNALDGNQYTLPPKICVIADEEKALGLGGVMGGVSSAVDETTSNIFIESAWFDPATTAYAARALNIQSEASYRFERGVDPASTISGCDLAASMVQKFCGGDISPILIHGKEPQQNRTVHFMPAQIRKLSGLEVADEKIKTFLDRLGFETQSGDVWQTTPPSWRRDIGGADPQAGIADITEEIIRLYGIDRLPETPLSLPVKPAALTQKTQHLRRARNILCAQGLVEAVSWSFLPMPIAQKFCDDAEMLKLANPISADLAVMRTSLLPSLLLAAARNLAYGHERIALFEAGHCFESATPNAQHQSIAALRQGATPRHWQSEPDTTLWTIKADMMAVFAACALNPERLTLDNTTPDYFHPARSGRVMLGAENILGYFGEIHPEILRMLDIAPPCFVFEINLDQLPLVKKKKTQKPLWERNSLQPVRRDLAFVLDKTITAHALTHAAKSVLKEFNAEIRLFDIFEDAALLGANKKSFTIEVSLYPKQVMTDLEIDALIQKLIGAVAEKTGGTLRG